MGHLKDISPDGKTLLVGRGPLDTTVFSFQLDDAQKEPHLWSRPGEAILTSAFRQTAGGIVYAACVLWE